MRFAFHPPHPSNPENPAPAYPKFLPIHPILKILLYFYCNCEQYRNTPFMKKTKLGEFEELVLLTVAALQEEAYGVEIKRELEARLSEKLSVGSIQSALKRMEDKGFLTSEFGEATMKRGGKRKRIYKTTTYAHKVLAEMKDIRAGLWDSIPTMANQLRLT